MKTLRWIRSAAFLKVKSHAYIGAALCLWLFAAFDGNAITPEPSLAPIQARTFASKSLEKSKSGRTYIFENLEQVDLPRVGRILLLKQNDDPVIAVRVMRTYEDQNRFAAKRVKAYGKKRELEAGEVTSNLEKLGDLEPLIPPSTQELADLKDLETKTQTVSPPPPVADVAPPPTVDPAPPIAEPPPFTPDGKPAPAYDPELDQETSPPPGRDASTPDLEDSDEDAEDPAEYLMVNDMQPKDIYKSWATVQFAEVRNNGSDGESKYYESIGLKFGYTFKRYLLAKTAKLQDSLTAEGGLGLYRVLAYEANQNDAYTLLPISGSLRYNLHISESMTVFGYGGLVMHRVLSHANGSQEAVNLLTSIFPAAGLGIFFQVGPQWYLRMDLGLESLGLGLVIRF